MYVIKTGGAVLARPDIQQRLANAWQNRTQDWVLVHGGGPQLDQALRAVQGTPRKVGGLRVTTTAGADAVRGTMSLLGAELAAKLRNAGVPATHVSPEENAFVAVPKTSRHGDLGRVGTVTDVRSRRIQAILDSGRLPVVTPVGWDAEGPLNVNADEGAAMVAINLGANRLTLITDVQAVLDAGGEPLPQITPRQAEHLIESGVAKGGMHAKLDQAIDAIVGGVPEVRIGPVSAAWNEDVGTTLTKQPVLEATTS